MQDNSQEINLEQFEENNLSEDQGKENLNPENNKDVEDTEAQAIEQSSEANRAENDEEKSQENEVERLTDQYRRLVAEFDNYKKRTQKEMGDLIQTANKNLVLLMLDVLDDMERAEKQEVQDINVFRQGVTLVFDKMRNKLQQIGVEKISALDEPFSTDKHEAITELSVEEDRRGKVVDVLQDGYTLKGKLIRFAKVIIGK